MQRIAVRIRFVLSEHLCETHKEEAVNRHAHHGHAHRMTIGSKAEPCPSGFAADRRRVRQEEIFLR